MITSFNRTHWRQHVALDVGTATIRITTGMTSVMEQPSRIGGRKALSDGVVVDGEIALHLLKPLFDRSRAFGIVKPRVLACAPSDARKEERDLLIDAIRDAGAAVVSVIPEPLAAAIGAGLDVSSQYAQMVLDIGEGVTDCAIIRAGRLHATCAVRLGCARMRRAITAEIERRCGTIDGEACAERLLRTCGIAHPDDGEEGEPARAFLPVLEVIADTFDRFCRELPHDLGCDVIDSGICLTGGGALIPGVPEYLERRIGIKVLTAINPLTSVVEGARAILPVILSLNQQWK